MKKSISIATLFILTTLNVQAQAGYEESKNAFKKHCAECHQMISIPANEIVKNYEGGNKTFNLKAPVVSMLAWAIMAGPKKVGEPNDHEMQKIEIETFLVDYLYNPNLEHSICDPRISSFHGAKESLKGKISEEDIIATVPYLMEYRDRKPEER